MGYLDNSGLSYLWNKIKSYLSSNYVSKEDANLMTPFAPGDTFDPVGIICAGLLTGSSKNIYFYIPLPKPIQLDAVNNITIPTSYSNLLIRHSDGGYIVTNSDTISSKGTITLRPRYGGIQCTLALSTAASFTNNAPVTVMFNGSTTITFNA